MPVCVCVFRNGERERERGGSYKERCPISKELFQGQRREGTWKAWNGGRGVRERDKSVCVVCVCVYFSVFVSERKSNIRFGNKA